MSCTSTANPSSGVIILQGSENYLEWIYTIEMASNRVWKFINPSRTLEEIEASKVDSMPQMPVPSDVKQGITRINQLSAGAEMEMYKMMIMAWKEQKEEFCEIERQLNMIQGKILGSISAKLLPQLRDKTTVPEILLYLNQRYRPSDQARRQQVINQWNNLKEKSAHIETFAWLDQWELVYADAKQLNLPHVASPQAQFDFLHSIKSIDSAWATTKLILIDEAINSNAHIPEIYKLIEQFRHNLKLSEIFLPESAKNHGGVNSSGVFTANHQNVESNLGAHKDRMPNGKRVFLCGSEHDFENCYYVNFKNRPAPHGWTYKKETFDKINKALSLPYKQNIRKMIEKKFGYNKSSTPLEALSKNHNSREDKNSVMETNLGSFISSYSDNRKNQTSSFIVDSES